MFPFPDSDHDPFERPRYQCALHGYEADDYGCPACADENAAFDLQQALAEELAPAQATNELMLALRRALDRVQAREDETKGAYLAQRFGGMK